MTKKGKPMIGADQIEEWIKEATERPASAGLIIQYVARRLAELSRRNEELLADNIALQSGAKVEEFQRRIAHLEYQLDLLRRQFGSAALQVEFAEAQNEQAQQAPPSLLVYDRRGRVLRRTISPQELVPGGALTRLTGDLAPELDPPRIMVVDDAEELLFIFTSGRVASLAVSNIAPGAPTAAGEALDWEQAPMPSEPNAGERLACIVPFARMALAECFVQASRKGCLKKIRAGMGQTILANHYIGTGVRQAPDETFSLALCANEDRLVLVSYEGYLQCVEVKNLPPSVEEALRLESSDHLVEVFVPLPERDILVMTQVGKAIHWTAERLVVANTNRSKGLALYSNSRREQGVRVVGAGAVKPADWGVALHSSGEVSLHRVRDVLAAGSVLAAGAVLAAGSVEANGELLGFSFFEFNGAAGD
jgi:DNA gyrase/topoisomerase IV subunit A